MYRLPLLTTEGFQTFEASPVAALKAVLGGFPIGRCANSGTTHQKPPLVFVLELFLALYIFTFCVLFFSLHAGKAPIKDS